MKILHSSFVVHNFAQFQFTDETQQALRLSLAEFSTFRK